ncbi:MAG: hypothetical protein M1340_02390 [Actinobacteria bacterium]|nr:hypothetical protein [Actinomycetota bacterium]
MSTSYVLKASAALALLLATLLLAGIVTATAGASTPPPNPQTYYFAWYDSMPAHGMTGDQIVIGNLQDHTAHAKVYFAKEPTPYATIDIPAHSSQQVTRPGFMGGPVRVVSTGGDALMVTQRVFYNNSFHEVAAIEGDNLDSSYYFTWYDSKTADGMNGNWLLIANEDSKQATVDVFIGDKKMGTYTIDPGKDVTPVYPEMIGGPVRVVSTNGMKLMVSQRVIYHGSFSEVMGYPASLLDNVYFFTWYDMTGNFSPGDWILISNLNNSEVHASVYVGDSSNPVGTYPIAPHQDVTPTYAGLMNGPVRVVCTDCTKTEKIMVSQRSLYKQSFEEVLGTPPSGLDSEMDFSIYNNRPLEGFNSWLLISNQGVGNAAANVYIGNSLQPKDSFNISQSGRETPSYPGLKDGPVRVLGDRKPLLASERTLYNDSFCELVGLPRKSTGQLLPQTPELQLVYVDSAWADYNNGVLASRFRIVNQGTGKALGTSVTSVHADSGVNEKTALPLNLGDIAGRGGYADFTIDYNVSRGLQSFKTTIFAHCKDSSGADYYYPKAPG